MDVCLYGLWVINLYLPVMRGKTKSKVRKHYLHQRIKSLSSILSHKFVKMRVNFVIKMNGDVQDNITESQNDNVNG